MTKDQDIQAAEILNRETAKAHLAECRVRNCFGCSWARITLSPCYGTTSKHGDRCRCSIFCECGRLAFWRYAVGGGFASACGDCRDLAVESGELTPEDFWLLPGAVS